MTTEAPSSTASSRPTSSLDILLDGLFTGMIGAIAVALWFLILDVAGGHPLRTPALLGSVLLGHGTPTAEVVMDPIAIAAYTAFHFVAFVVVGVVFAYLMTLFERFPIVFFVLLVLFACLQVGVFALDAVLGSRVIGRLQPWSVVVANLLAAAGMAYYQWKRHPSVLRKIETLWQDEVAD